MRRINLNSNRRNLSLTLIPLFAALTAAGAFIKVPMPLVPLTLQTLMVYLSGLFLGAGGGALSQILYIAIGLLGLPVFSGGGGPAYVVSPTFGYILGFVFASAASGHFAKRGGMWWPAVGVAIAILVVYIFGLPYFYLVVKYVLNKEMSLLGAIELGFFPFIVSDVIKASFALVIFYSARSALGLPITGGAGGRSD
jgi:biotin transport system substrate-specific component